KDARLLYLRYDVVGPGAARRDSGEERRHGNCSELFSHHTLPLRSLYGRRDSIEAQTKRSCLSLRNFHSPPLKEMREHADGKDQGEVANADCGDELEISIGPRSEGVGDKG